MWGFAGSETKHGEGWPCTSKLKSLLLYKCTAGNVDVVTAITECSQNHTLAGSTPCLQYAFLALLLACTLSACTTRSLDRPVRTRLTTDCTPQLRVWYQNSTVTKTAWLRHQTAAVLANRGSTAVCLFSSLQCCSRASENPAVHLSLEKAS